MEKETIKDLLDAWGGAHWDLNLPRFAAVLGLDISTPSGERYAEELFRAFGEGLGKLSRLDTDNLTKLANYRTS